MRIAIIGAGGTGGYFGGLLARAGEDITFIARGAHLDALRAHGITVQSPTEQFTVPAQATDDPASVGPVDFVLFCVKAYDTESAAEQIRPLVGTDTMLLSVQNGIDNEERIAAIVGREQVIGGFAGVVAKIERPGVIAVTVPIGGGYMRIGELPRGTSARVERLRETLVHANIPTEVLPDISVGLWEKFLFICALSGVTSLTRLPTGPIFACAETRAFYRGVMEEVAAVARARGVALTDDVVDRWMEQSAAVPGGAYGSMYHDLAAGRRMELDSLNGTLVRLGQECGVPTPLNFAIYAALKPYADGAPG